MSILTKLLLLGTLGWFGWVRLRTLLTYFQQEEYNPRRFLNAWVDVRLFDVFASAAVLVALVLLTLTDGHWVIYVALGAGLVLIAAREARHKWKKPLAMTERARRIYHLAAAFMVIPLALVFAWPWLALVVIQALPLSLIAANALLAPMQERINQGFIDEARAKLARIEPVTIGITGSFGKTTVKHILAEIMEASGPTFYSRGSINTVLGLTRHIRQRLQFSHRYFIAEMGAYGIGSIQRLCDFAQPTYGIITAVGDAHTERFGSVEVIAQAKSELAQNVLDQGGKAVINADVLKWDPFKRLKDAHGARMISVGPEGADVVIAAAEMAGGNWTITLRWADGAQEITYSLPLLGEHNVMNSALAVVLAVNIDPAIAEELPYFTEDVAQVPHRLQKIDNISRALILDDAYNANERGFMSAVDTARALADERGGRAILVTPGLVELGPEHDPVHRRLGEFVNGRADVVYAVNPDRMRAFTRAIDGGQVVVHEVASFQDARRGVMALIEEGDVVLYENDLPDVLEEKRLL